jgi:hypothetical protein
MKSHWLSLAAVLVAPAFVVNARAHTIGLPPHAHPPPPNTAVTWIAGSHADPDGHAREVHQHQHRTAHPPRQGDWTFEGGPGAEAYLAAGHVWVGRELIAEGDPPDVSSPRFPRIDPVPPGEAHAVLPDEFAHGHQPADRPARFFVRPARPGDGAQWADWNTNALHLVEEAFQKWMDFGNASGPLNWPHGDIDDEELATPDAVPWRSRVNWQRVDTKTIDNEKVPIEDFELLIAYGDTGGKTVTRYRAGHHPEGSDVGVFREAMQLIVNRTANWFWDINPNPAVAPAQHDLFSTLLHEIGHVLGLDHFGTYDAGQIMAEVDVAGAAGRPARGDPIGGIQHTLDLDAIHGIRDLYAICDAAAGGGAPAPLQATEPHSVDAAAECPCACAAAPKDYGDAPDTYHTLLASDGPRYEESYQQMLGRLRDAEADGQPTALADGDDLSLLGGLPAARDDEDGVRFDASSVDVTLSILRPGTHDYQLRGWWDLDTNGCFDHATADTCNGGSEMVIDELLTLSPGEYVRHYDLGFNPRDFFSRFRLTWGAEDFDVWPYKEFASAIDGMSHGEVEDHIPEPSLLALSLAASVCVAWRRRRTRTEHARKAAR